MKVQAVRYEAGGMSIELIGETEFEVAMLNEAWRLQEMTRGNGKTITASGAATGFYLAVTERQT